MCLVYESGAEVGPGTRVTHLAGLWLMNYARARGRGRRATGVRISNVIRAAVAGAVTPPGEIYAPVNVVGEGRGIDRSRRRLLI